ncbi:MAG: methyltransferase domain-containing protein [Akkermansiaceae bacterium]
MKQTLITEQRRYGYAAQKIGSLGPDVRPRVVFDVGAGAGPMQAPTEQVGLAWYGFDLYPEKSSVATWDLSDPCPEGDVKAGLVLMMDVIEHLLNPGLALDNITNAMAAGSYIVITTPNPRASRSRLHALFTGFPACFTKQDLDLNHHVFPVWQHVLEYMLASKGFEILEWCQLRGRHSIPAPRMHPKYFLQLGKAIVCRLIEAKDPTAISTDYAVLAKRG